MHKFVGVLFIVLGIIVGLYNYFFRSVNLTSSAVMQLEDSDVAYGIGSRLATSDSGWMLTLVTLVCIGYGLYKFLKKPVKPIEKETT